VSEATSEPEPEEIREDVNDTEEEYPNDTVSAQPTQESTHDLPAADQTTTEDSVSYNLAKTTRAPSSG